MVGVARGEGVGEADVRRAVALLAGRLALQGVQVDVRGPLRELGSRYALGRSPAEPGPELGALVAFAREPAEGVQLLVVDRIVDPRSALARSIVLEGFGIHPSGPVSEEAGVVRDALRPVVPLLVVERGALSTVDRGGRLLLHELGHATGSAHGDAVMRPEAPPCLDGFTDAQLRRAIAP